MALTAKGKSSNEGWDMGFLVVFFPQDDQHSDISNENNNNKKKKNNMFSSSPSPSSSTFKPRIMNSPLIRRITSSNHQLLSRAQSTISICALLIFITLLLFTLSTFESTTTSASINHFTSRRHLSTNPLLLNKPRKPHSTLHALQGMGTLYRTGTNAMNAVVVGHVSESITEQQLRLFLRLFHRSVLASRSDLVLIFPSPSHSSSFQTVILEENESFSELVRRTRSSDTNSTVSFDLTPFVKSSEKGKELGKPIWGRQTRSNGGEEGVAELTRLSYGSVVSFVADELDSENSLAGFLDDNVPMSLRRWACYPMLLGRVRRNFKHVLLADVKEVLIVGDPLGRVRTRSPESVHLSSDAPTIGKRGKENSVETQSRTDKPVNSAVIMGGTRGVRRLSNAMLTEIVRAATQHKRKNSFTESGLFSQLVGNEFALKNINVVVTSTESIPEASPLTGLNSNSSSSLPVSNYTVVRRGNSNTDITSYFLKQFCLLELDSSVYSDC